MVAESFGDQLVRVLDLAVQFQQLQRCVAEATRSQAGQWACLGSSLHTGTEAPGSPVDVNQGSGVRQIGPLDRVHEPGVVAPAQDDYETWCGNRSTCDRKILNYIMESKGNVAYGQGPQVIGSFDVILRNNLNGPYPRYTAALDWDSGPNLYFQQAEATTWESISYWPDTIWGTNTLGQGVYLTPSVQRFNSGRVSGPRLNENGEFYATVNARFVPTGQRPMVLTPLESPVFNCYRTAPCRFP